MNDYIRGLIADAIYRAWNPATSGFQPMHRIPKDFQEDMFEAADIVLGAIEASGRVTVDRETLREMIRSEVFNAFVGDFPAPPLSRASRSIADRVLRAIEGDLDPLP